MSAKPLPAKPHIAHLKKQAKALLKAHKAGEKEVCAHFKEILPRFSDASTDEILGADFSLRDAQHVIACEYGFRNWSALLAAVFPAFEELVHLGDAEVQILLREIGIRDLCPALKDASPELKKRFFGNMSKRMRSFIEGEMEFWESISPGEIEEAQQRIVLRQWRLTSPEGKKTRKSKPQEVSERLKAMAHEGQRYFTLPLSQLSIDQVMTVLVSLSELSLREGILALEEAGIEDDFVKEALWMTVDGTEPDLLVDMLETRHQTLRHHYEMRYRITIEGMLAITAGDNPGVVQHKLHAMYMPGLGKGYVPRKVSIAEVRGKLKRQPFSQRNFDEITEVITDMATIRRREGIRRLIDLMDLIDDELLKQALQLATAEMAWRSMVDPLETRMKDLIEKQNVRYCMVIEGICAIQKGWDPSAVEEEMKEVAQV